MGPKTISGTPTRKSRRLNDSSKLAINETDVRTGVQQNVDSDDDFTSPPFQIFPRRSKDQAQSGSSKQNKRKAEGTGRRKYDVVFKSRCSPLQLVSSFKKLSEVQKQEIRDIGFGQILDLQFKVIHGQLARWLVESFDAEACTLKLPQGNIRITEEHVHNVLGLPMGEININLPPRADRVNTLANDWKKHFKLEGAVFISRVRKLINQTRQGGKWFLKSFMVLFFSTMIASNNNGSCNLRIFEIMDDVKDISKYNWCKYTLKSLIDSKREWLKGNAKSNYAGPIVFLKVPL